MEDMQQAIWYHVVTVTPLLIFKLAVLVVGYLIARLGYELLVKGVTGQFKFSSEIKGAKADMVSASPGLFFILMAAVLITVGVLKDKPFETRIEGTRLETRGESPQQSVNTNRNKPVLPVTPDGG